MTDRDALYAAVLAAPDDDTPRLVYADWLTAQGDTGTKVLNLNLPAGPIETLLFGG